MSEELLHNLNNITQALKQLSERVSNIENLLVEMQKNTPVFSPPQPCIEQTRAGQHLQQLGITL